MAESSSLQREVSEIVTCPICLEDFKDPRLLPCVHTFCFQCLQGLYEDKNPGDNVSCPVCRKKFQIPQGGLNSLPLNFFLQNLIEAKDLNSRPKETETLCDKHPDKLLELYCCQCKRNICMKCFAVSHQQHKCEEIEKISKVYIKQIQSDVKPFSSRISQFRKSLSKVEEAKEKFLQTIQEMEQGVRQRGDEIKRLVDEHVAKLTEKLNEVRERSVEEAETCVESINLALAALESFQAYSLEIASKGSHCDITRSFNELQTKAKELLKSHVITDDYCPPVVQFEPTEELIKGRLRNIVGGLIVQHLLYIAFFNNSDTLTDFKNIWQATSVLDYTT